MFEIVAFIIFSVLTTSMFLITVFTSNTLYALSSLAAGMIFISGLFFLLDAEFLGVVQIVVYTGAVMALYAFGMMFFDSLTDVKEKINNPRLAFFLSGMIALIVVVILIAPILGKNIEISNPVNAEAANSINIGLVLLFSQIDLPRFVSKKWLKVARYHQAFQSLTRDFARLDHTRGPLSVGSQAIRWF